jgi:transcriptional antiterminator Rof (Rho-off)
MAPDATPSPISGHLAPHLHDKLEAAMILRGVVKLVLDHEALEVQPRTWYRENGTEYLEARRRSNGERLVFRLEQIRDVQAY